MRELSDTVLGPITPTTNEEEPTVAEENNEEVPAWAQALIDQNKELADKVEAFEKQGTASAEAEEARRVEGLKEKARGFAFEEGTREWQRFFQIAASDLADGDLDTAKNLYEKLEGELPTAEGGNEEGEGTEGGGGGDEKPKFPKSGAAGGSGAPDSSASEENKLDFKDKSAVNAAAQAYMEAAESENATTP